MKGYRRMKILTLYTVIKSSTDHSIQEGDLIWLSKNGDLNSVNGQGWLSKEEWDLPGTNDFKCEISKTYYLDVINGSEIVRRIQDVRKIVNAWNVIGSKKDYPEEGEYLIETSSGEHYVAELDADGHWMFMNNNISEEVHKWKYID